MSKYLRDATDIVLIEGIPLIKQYLAKGYEPFGIPMMQNGCVNLMMTYHTPLSELVEPEPIVVTKPNVKVKNASKSTV
jgi:hypothetical protein